MARTANSDAAVTRQRILDAATHCFAAQGRAGVSIRFIAAEAGVNSALISHYFGGKDGLYNACLQEVYGALGDWREDLLRGAPSPVLFADWIAHAVGMGLRFVKTHRSSLRLVTQEVMAQGGLGIERREGVLVPFLEQGSALISPFSKKTVSEIRFALQSIVFLLVRYGLSSPEDVEAVSGTQADADDCLESHLIHVAQDMLGA